LEKKGYVMRGITLLLVIAATLGIFNVVSDNAAVIVLAEDVACGGAKCSLAMTRMVKTPIGQSFTFQTNAAGRTASVACRRAFFLLGAYQCKTE
jgi:hypothetical protein